MSPARLFFSCLAAAAAFLVSACAQDSGSPPPSPAPPTISVTAPAPQPSPAPSPSPARRAASYNSVHTSRPVLALTFDDGPHPELTPKLLDLLRREGVRATFYVIGRSVDEYPEIARRIVAEGHEIANHSYTHPALTGLSASRLASEIEKTTAAIERATGRRPTNMRPPYGAINERVRRTMTQTYGLDVIMWSVDPLDWKRPGASVVTQRLVDGATPGGILLTHDIHPGTIEAMPETIKRLKEKGYGFVTVSQLLALQEPVPPPTPKPTATPAQQAAMR
jgi:peptidoglycan/xylan/chitin deacetylase (PgdA/CDA1 family)